MAPVARLVAASLLAVGAGGQVPVLPEAHANPLDRKAGRFSNDMQTVRLVAQRARWYPEAEHGPALTVETFGEEGRGPTVPGPLIRVRTGTYVFVSVRNTLDDTLLIMGFGLRRPGLAGDTLRVAPGATAARRFTAEDPGALVYYGITVSGADTAIGGPGGQLTGALIVDTAVAPPDRIFLMSGWTAPWDSSDSSASERVVFAINGKSWPYTERQRLAVGDTVHWRVLDATGASHPMHLHGFYFRVDGRASWEADTAYAPDARPEVVTADPPPDGALSLTWAPHSPGRWLFHCHRAFHMSGDRHGDLAGKPDTIPIHAHGRDHASLDMAGLILGIEVTTKGRLRPPPAPARSIRLLAQSRAGHWGVRPGFGYVIQADAVPAADSVVIPGAPLELTRGERVAITVVNRLPEPTTVHWHGIEVENGSDGVAGWSGIGAAVAPLILPGDSFTARFTPPRAGTFIYHTHVHEFVQMPGGLVGPLLVLEPGTRRDPAVDHAIVLHDVFDGDSRRAAINGSAHPAPLVLRAGVAHRLRLIAIFPQRVGEVRLRPAWSDSAVTWQPIAKDGADLPAARRGGREARIAVAPGETYDLGFGPLVPGEFALTLECPDQEPVVLPIIVR